MRERERKRERERERGREKERETEREGERKGEREMKIWGYYLVNAATSLQMRFNVLNHWEEKYCSVRIC